MDIAALASLNETARALVAPGKGILAADESSGTIKKRFDSISLESTEQNRRAYRELLFTTDGAEQYISGVILYDETIRQSTKDGVPFPQELARRGVIPGIKVDVGAMPLALSEGETITDALPSSYCIGVNAAALARYAALCQEADVVPIVEPEVLMEGDHTIDRADDVTATVLEAVFHELFSERVSYDGMLLKPNMVLSGYSAKRRAGVEEVAQ